MKFARAGFSKLRRIRHVSSPESVESWPSHRHTVRKGMCGMPDEHSIDEMRPANLCRPWSVLRAQAPLSAISRVSRRQRGVTRDTPTHDPLAGILGVALEPASHPEPAWSWNPQWQLLEYCLFRLHLSRRRHRRPWSTLGRPQSKPSLMRRASKANLSLACSARITVGQTIPDPLTNYQVRLDAGLLPKGNHRCDSFRGNAASGWRMHGTVERCPMSPVDATSLVFTLIPLSLSPRLAETAGVAVAGRANAPLQDHVPR
jgi:hypothetical protein